MLAAHSASVLENVTNAAVWGSLAASFCLGAFLIVQSFVDSANRGRFAAFAAINFLVWINDLCHPYLSLYDYERIRIVLWSLYPGILLWLLRMPLAAAFAAPAILASAATVVWTFWKPELGTSFVVGPAAYVAAIAHGIDYRRRRCYASCVLCGTSLALGMLSTFYYLFIVTGDQALIVTGYAHYAALSLVALLFGWIHLPREMSGRAPVRVSGRAASFYVACMAAGQGMVLLSLLAISPWSLGGYLLGALLLLGATFLLFFHHRHQLVVYTENVTLLLDERTQSLREARDELAHQNELQAQMLVAQANEINAKNDVIQRQRRLELAAQTAGQAAHDIRNLLSPLSSQLDLLQRRFVDHPVQDHVRVMRRQMTRLKELTDQLLALSRRGQLAHQPVMLNELLRDVSLDSSGTPIRIEWEGEAWASGSPAQLLRAITNLLSNALDATSNRHGAVRLACGSIKLSAEKRCHMGFLSPGRYSYVRVADSGPGIPANIIDRIFEPFFSSKQATSTAGSGLGLSIVAAVVDDHDGILDIETSVTGTTFTIYLPHLDPPEAAQRSATGSRSSRILIVDDDSEVVKMSQEVLRRAGYHVASASSVAECREILDAKSPDLILLDFHLLDGTAEQILQSLATRNHSSKILIFSAYLSNEIHLRLSNLGVSRLAYKPLGPLGLLTAVEEALADIQGTETHRPTAMHSN